MIEHYFKLQQNITTAKPLNKKKNMERCKCCGSVLPDLSSFDLLKKITVLIEKDQLDGRSRKQNLKHKRCYLYRKMRDRGMSLQSIGEYFNRDHATVVNGLYIEECLRKDKIYLKDTEEYDNLFQNNQ